MPLPKKSTHQFITMKFFCACLFSILLSYATHSQIGAGDKTQHIIHEINAKEIPVSKRTIAITGAMIVDGNGGEPVFNGCVVVKNGRIAEVGINGKIKIPNDAEIIDARGM